MNELEYLKEEIINLNKKLDILINKEQVSCKYFLFEWLDTWLEVYNKPFVKYKSYKSNEQCIRIHIKSNIKNINLKDLTALDIQQALNKIQSTRMRKYTYDVYHAALLQAQKLEIISKNPMINVLAVKHIRKTGRALTIEEQQQFLKIIKGNKLEKLYKFYLYSGCRLSEVFDITQNDIDYKNKTIHIKGTKTKTSDRYIPIHQQLEDLLKSIEIQDFLFPYNSNIVICNFKRLKNKYKLTYTMHSLRHTYATRLLENGVSMKVVQKWLGHSKLDTTANIYMHIQTDFEKREISKVKF